jgi:hypothetical protein
MARRQDIETRLTATDKTKAAFNRVQKRMKSLKKVSLVAGAGLAAVAASFVVAAKKAVNFSDDIAKQSRQIGISTKAFQEMRLAADLAGVSEETFGGALAKLGKNLEEFRLGTGTLMTFLDKLGDESFANLMKQTTDTEQAFKLFIKRIDQATSSQQKLALANAAFGRGVGQALAGMSFKEFEKGLKLAREFGVVIDKKFLKEAEKIKDAFTIVSAVFRKEFFTEILNMLSTMNLPKFAKDMARLAAATFRFVKAIGEWFGIIKKTVTPLQTLQTELGVTDAAIRALTDKRSRAMPNKLGLNEWSRYLNGLKEKADGLRASIALLKNPKEILVLDTDLPPEPKKHLLPFVGDGDVTATALNKLTLKLAEYRAGIVKTKTNLEELTGQNFSSIEAMEIEAQRLDTTRGVQEALNAMRKDGLGISKAFENALIAEANAVDALNLKLEKKKDLLQPGPIQQYIDSTKDLKTSLEDLAVSGVEGFNDSLAGMINGTVRAADAFKSMALSIIASMQKMIIKKLILDRVMGFIKTAIGSITAPTTPLNSGFETIDALASGGPASAGRPYMVGERGPELMVPNRSGTVIPNHALGGGGAVINQTINIQTGVSQTVRAEILTLMPQINQATKAAVLDARQRGGSFANGFA